MPVSWNALTIPQNSRNGCVALPVARVGRLGRREGDRVVAPEVPQLLAGQRVDERAVVLVELVDRQQLDGRDARDP